MPKESLADNGTIKIYQPNLANPSLRSDETPCTQILSEELVEKPKTFADVIYAWSLVAPSDRQHVVELAPQALHRRLEHAEGRHRPAEQGCQMTTGKFLDCRLLALWAGTTMQR